ncbi:MAG: class I SAM-dependent methyltransferase [Pseudomonadota bacterium]
MTDRSLHAGSVLDLTGVPETMLWPLWHRVGIARKGESLLADPMANELVDQIDYPFERHFGKPSVFHAIRGRHCDDLIRAYVGKMEDDAVVVGLGEGLETQPWRFGNSTPRWFSVDLPEAIAVRQRLMPEHPKLQLVACSALDPAWMDRVPTGTRPFITASGLLMYFRDEEIRGLLATIAERFPGAELFFDTIPPMFAARTRRGFRVTPHYTAPEMPWGISIDRVTPFLTSCGWTVQSCQTYAEPYPDRLRFYALLSKIGPIRRRFAPGLVHARTSDFGHVA